MIFRVITMNFKSLICYLSILIIISCDNHKVIQQVKDDFNIVDTIWNRSQTTSDKNYKIISDPKNPKNKVIKFQLYPDDYISSGKRSEFTLKTKDTIGLKVKYSYKFLFKPDFFSKKKEQDWVMLHQWHDKPPKNLNWKNYGMLTKPPIHLYVQLSPDNNYSLVYAYGLANKNKYEMRHIPYQKTLKPNQWYTFENEVLWGTQKTAYSKPKINDSFLIKNKENKEHKIFGPNMYNSVPNYFKLGLYGNNKSNDTISVLIDNFEYILTECKN